MKSRYLWIGLAVVFALTLAVAPAFADDLPKIDVDISTHDSSAEWYKNPIIIGGGALLFVLIVALASRGGGTTVVKS